jgi:hypothetical protein
MRASYQAVRVSFDIYPDWQARILRPCAFCRKKSHVLLFIRVPTEVQLKVERTDYHICLKCTKRLLAMLPPLGSSNVLKVYDTKGRCCIMCSTVARYEVAVTFPLITKVEFLKFKGITYTIDAETRFRLHLCSTHVKSMISASRFVDYIKEGRG